VKTASRAQQHPGQFVELADAPVDTDPDRAVARRSVPAAPAEQSQQVVQPARHLGEGQQAGAAGGQFDGQRQSVKPAADLGGDGFVEVPPGGAAVPRVHRVAGRARPGDGQPHFRLGAGREQGDRVAHGHRRHPPRHLARHAEANPAGRQELNARAAREQDRREGRRRLRDLVAVVQDDQQPAFAELVRHPLGGRGTGMTWLR